MSLNEAQDAILDGVCKLGHAPVGDVAPVLGDRVAAAFEVADAFLDPAAALAQFALEADTRFADLALQTVAGGRAPALEATEVTLDLLLYGASLVLEFLALIVLRVREPNLARPFRVPGGLFGAIMIGVCPALLLGFSVAQGQQEQILGMSSSTCRLA